MSNGSCINPLDSSCNSSDSTLHHTTEEFPDDRRSLCLIIFGAIFMLFIALISIVGNAAVVAVSYWSQPLRVQIGNLLIVNLAIIDMVNGMIVMFPAAVAVAMDHWPFGNFLCYVHSCFQYSGACGASFNMAVISIDRSVAVMFPLQYPQKMTTNVMLIMSAYVVLQGFSVGISSCLTHVVIFDYWEAQCALKWDGHQRVYELITSSFFICFAVPAVIIITCNGLIILSAKKSNKKTAIVPIGINGRINTQAFVKLKSIRSKSSIRSNKTVLSMMVVTSIYYTCFTPYVVSKLMKCIGGLHVPSWVDFAATIAIFISSASNPFIYGILRKDYRDAFKKLPAILQRKMQQLF